MLQLKVVNMMHELSDVDKEIYACLDLKKPSSFFLFAGAGSGKTGSLVRVLKEFRNNHSHELRLNGQKVAIITYTNAACDEIKRRLEFDSIFTVSTIHSFCWELIKPFQSDIKDWVRQNTEQELEELQQAQEKGRAGTKAAIDRGIKIASKNKRLHNLDKIRTFVYNPNGTNSSHNSLNHAEVIKIASEFLDSKSLMQTILISKYPILLIDESQDTKKELIEALMKIQPLFSSKFCLGLFGDTMQRIYSDGKLDLGHNLPDDWKRPEKNINYRCPKRVIELINTIRGDQPQIPGDSNEDGVIRLFVIDTTKNIDKLETESFIINQMAEITGDIKWNAPSSIKVLTLEHKMAARRGDFLDFFQPLYDLRRDSSGLIDGSMSGMPFFIQRLIPLVQAIHTDDDFLIAELIRKFSPLLDKQKLRDSSSPYQLIQQAQQAVDELHALWNTDDQPLLIDVLKKVFELKLFELPEILLPIVKRGKEYSEADDNEDDKNSDIDAWEAALSAPYPQIEAYNDYISERSRFGTHQGVKGLEFPRVMVILDDDEAGGFLFSYEKLLGAKEPSQRDLENISAGNETTIDRTKRLFYVTCSRAEKSLAIVTYTKNPKSVQEYAISQGWFNKEEIVTKVHCI